VKAAHAGGCPIARGRRRCLQPRSRGSHITAERCGLARRPRRRRVLLPAATAATLLHTQPAISTALMDTAGDLLPAAQQHSTPSSKLHPNRSDHNIHGSSQAAAGGIQLHPKRRRPSEFSPVQTPLPRGTIWTGAEIPRGGRRRAP
jgi:hypothetical protein